MKNVDLDEPTSFLDHENLGCTQRECKPNEIVMKKCREMFESRISAGATDKLPGWGKPHAKKKKGCVVVRHGNMLKNALRDVANWRTKDRAAEVSSPCLDDHHFMKEELESVGEDIKSMLTNCLEMLVLGTNW